MCVQSDRECDFNRHVHCFTILCDFRPIICLDGEENHNSPHWSWQGTSRSQFIASKMSFSFHGTLGSVTRSCSHKEILAYPTHTFHVDLEHLPQVLRWAPTSIAQYSFSVNPHTRREFRSHPLLFGPTLHIVHHSHRVEERGGLWHGLCIRYIVSATFFIRNVVPSELLSFIRSRSHGIVIHSVVMP